MSRIVFMMLLFVPGLAEEFRARLVNGTANAGRLEILYRGEWSTVCHDGFGIQEARVACRMLGFSSSRATVVASGAYGAGAGRILLDDVKCHGTENSLAECRHMTYYSSDCSHRRDVGVICYEAKHFVARIVNGSENSGRLEIFYDGEWSTVCDKGFGKKEATVACRMLGLNSTGATVVTISKYGEGAGRILLKEVKCQGTESSLPECDVSTFYPSDCSHSDDVAVACYEVSPGPARLANGDRKSGRLEIYHKGEWSTVCNTGFEDREARVACRMLGFNSSDSLVVETRRYGEGAGRILPHEVNCEGTESSLEECDLSNFHSSRCGHSKDVGLICNEVGPVTARLANGTHDGGRLEIFHNGKWSTVCAGFFGDKEARVACRMLGFNSSGGRVVHPRIYGAGAGEIILNDVYCKGTESSLVECYHNRLYHHNCRHSDHVGVTCDKFGPVTARLANGDRKAGRLEIFYNGKWSTVCNNGFGDKEARVACRMLGFNSSGGRVVHSHIYGAGKGEIILDDVNCKGNESSLAECSRNRLYYHDCKHSDDVGVTCKKFSPLTARLVNGVHQTGRLEVFHNREWSTVCTDGFGDKEARVACRTLGYDRREAKFVPTSVYGAGTGGIYPHKVKCQGTEINLAECNHTTFDSHNCSHNEDVGLICKNVMQLRARLDDGDIRFGRLELFHNGEWGTVCDAWNRFGDKEARVACRMLGFNSSNARVDKAGVFRPWRKGKGRIAVSQVNCVGTESSVAECDYSSDTSSCFHEDDVRVICNEDSTDLKLTARLVNGDGMSGRLEIFHNGEWGTVCNDIFEDTEARVACRMLGLKSFGATVVDTSTYGQGAGTIIFNHVACRGTENSLEECEVSNFYSIGCRHSEDVGVICKEDSPVAARLADGDAEGGRLELFHNGQWKSVCSSRFGDKSALVACRMAGFNSSAIVAATSNAYGSGAGRIIFDYVKCRGTESSLLDCRYKKLDITECDHSDDIGVICKEETTTVTSPGTTTVKLTTVTKPTTKSVIKKDSSLPTTTSPTTTTTTEKITKVTTTTKSRTGNATAVTTSTTTTSTTTTVTLEP